MLLPSAMSAPAIVLQSDLQYNSANSELRIHQICLLQTQGQLPGSCIVFLAHCFCVAWGLRLPVQKLYLQFVEIVFAKTLCWLISNTQQGAEGKSSVHVCSAVKAGITLKMQELCK